MIANSINEQDLEHVLAHTRPLWEEMRGRRLFVTGGTGFFGCWLVETFCHANRVLGLDAQATILTRDPAKFRAKCPHLASNTAITLRAGDVRDFEFPPGEFGYVIHAATEASAKQEAEAPQEMLSTIVEGTERTLEFATQCGARKFLLTSSGAVYGPQPAEMTHVPESYLAPPDVPGTANVYAEGKRTAEQMCARYPASFETKIARCFAFCGPYLPLDTHFAIGNFIGDALAGRPISIAGDVSARRSYLYAADLTIWLWTMLFRAPGLMPINVGSAHDVSIRDLAETVAATLAPHTEIKIAKQSVPGATPSRYVPSVERAESILGLHERIGLEEGIRRTAAWHGFVRGA